MSASDAAPLPRLGEVFFDVRGNSRSMRLSWYADTDVAVFSIWQGGKCTGTFRLPMDDLGRMIEILQRGPEGRSGRRAGERRPPVSGERGAYGPRDRGNDSDRTVVHSAGGRTSAVSAGDYGAGQYGTGDYSSRQFGPEGQGPGEYGSDDYGEGDYGPGDYGPGDHRSGEYRPAEYDGYSQSRSARHRTERYEPADHAREQQDGEWWSDSDDDGYGEQRFAPPYARSRPEPSEPGFMDDSEYRLPADPAGRSRHSAGRHSGGQAQ